MSLTHYKRNQVYDLPSTVANYMVAENLAMVEMRNTEKGTAAPNGEERRLSAGSRGKNGQPTRGMRSTPRNSL
jgi:hypothetical protein